MRAGRTGQRHLHIERSFTRFVFVVVADARLGTGDIPACVQLWIDVAVGIAAEFLGVEHCVHIRVKHVAGNQDRNRGAGPIQATLLAGRTDHALVGRITIGLLEIVVGIVALLTATVLRVDLPQPRRVHMVGLHSASQAGDHRTTVAQRRRQLQGARSGELGVSACRQIRLQWRGKHPFDHVGTGAHLQGGTLLDDRHVRVLQGRPHAIDLLGVGPETTCELVRR